MDITTILIFCGFILVGFLAGYPIGAMMERRDNNRRQQVLFLRHTQPRPAPIRVRHVDSILDAEYLEEESHAH